VGRKKKPFLEQVRIEDVAAEGKAVAKYNDKVVFVPQAIPGDLVDIQVTKKRKKFLEGRVTKYHELSEDRVDPFCKHFGICGGCKWQMMPYEKQAEYKQKQVEQQLTRIGKVELPQISPILGSAKTQYYRNKLEFTFSCNRWLALEEMGSEQLDTDALGFHIPGLFDKIVDIEHCYLQDEPSNAIRLALKAFTKEKGYAYFNQRSNEGFMRNVVVRTSSTGECMVIVIFAYDDQEAITATMEHLKEKFADVITSYIYIVNTKVNDSYADLEPVTYHGNPFMMEEMEGLKFKVGPKSFYQTNSAQAYELYKVTREFAELKGDEVVYDLYTGTGTIASFVAKHAKKVLGIEYVEPAVIDGRENLRLNNIDNVKLFAGDMKDVLNDAFINEHGTPDVIITDPPRAGMHESVVQTILRCKPKRIVYVSCNPATQARDIQLMDSLYRVEKVQPVDMFPHTHHVENVVSLVLKNV
jgi:23S rRNA (uracil1939-C5)-methyltransferase